MAMKTARSDKRVLQAQRAGRDAARPPLQKGKPLHPVQHLQQQVGNARVARLATGSGEGELLAMAQVGRAGGPISNRLAARIQAQQGRGNPLDRSALAQMESAFGRRLDDVRLHTDAEADALSQQVSATAFAAGKDIFFRRDVGPDDISLLAHELAHVVQQDSLPGGGPMQVEPVDATAEREADAAARKAAAGKRVRVQPAGVSVARQFAGDLEYLSDWFESAPEEEWNPAAGLSSAFSGGAQETLGEAQPTASGNFREAGPEVWDTNKEPLGDAWDTEKEPMGDVWDTGKEPLADIWDTNKEPLGDAWDTNKEPLWDDWGTPKDVGSAGWDMLSDVGSEVWETAKDVGSAGWDLTKDVGSEVWETTKDVGSEVWETSKDVASGGWDLAKEAGSAGWDLLEKASEGAGEAWETVEETGASAWDWLGNAVEEGWTLL